MQFQGFSAGGKIKKISGTCLFRLTQKAPEGPAANYAKDRKRFLRKWQKISRDHEAGKMENKEALKSEYKKTWKITAKNWFDTKLWIFFLGYYNAF